MAKWVLKEEDGSWIVLLNGRFKQNLRNEKSRDTWLKKHIKTDDKIFLQEDDGYLVNITKKFK